MHSTHTLEHTPWVCLKSLIGADNDDDGSNCVQTIRRNISKLKNGNETNAKIPKKSFSMKNKIVK